MTDSKFLVLVNSVIVAMSTNFASAVDLPALIAARDAFVAALSAAQQGGILDKSIRDQAKAALVDQMHHVADWVIYHCNNDRTLAMGSGFPLSKEESVPSPAIGPATQQLLKDGPNSGELLYSFKRVPGAKSYIYQITEQPPTPQTVWTDKSGTVCKVSFTGLESGKRYWVRVQAIGIDGQCVCSEPISRVTQ
jgi:hypothetical protein